MLLSLKNGSGWGVLITKILNSFRTIEEEFEINFMTINLIALFGWLIQSIGAKSEVLRVKKDLRLSKELIM